MSLPEGTCVQIQAVPFVIPTAPGLDTYPQLITTLR